MRRLTTAEFIVKARIIHGDKYDYSKSTYVNMHTKVCIICPEHGEFWMTPNNHLFQKQDCGVCGDIKCGKSCIEHHKAKRPDLSHIETPEGSKVVPLTQGKYAIVDEEEYDRVMEYNWQYSGGYAKNDQVGLMHRFIVNPPDDKEVDHKFHNTLDNRKSQLRICTRHQNSFNTSHYGKTSKYKGVYKSPRNQGWSAQITHNYKTNYLGYFDNEEEAARAYDKAAKEIQGDFAKLNFPTQ